MRSGWSLCPLPWASGVCHRTRGRLCKDSPRGAGSVPLVEKPAVTPSSCGFPAIRWGLCTFCGCRGDSVLAFSPASRQGAPFSKAPTGMRSVGCAQTTARCGRRPCGPCRGRGVLSRSAADGGASLGADRPLGDSCQWAARAVQLCRAARRAGRLWAWVARGGRGCTAPGRASRAPAARLLPWAELAHHAAQRTGHTGERVSRRLAVEIALELLPPHQLQSAAGRAPHELAGGATAGLSGPV